MRSLQRPRPRRARSVRPQAGVPARSRLTVRPGARLPLARSVPLADALRTSRLALSDLEGQLQRLLMAVRSPVPLSDAIPPDAPERLRSATRAASAALAGLVIEGDTPTTR